MTGLDNTPIVASEGFNFAAPGFALSGNTGGRLLVATRDAGGSLSVLSGSLLWTDGTAYRLRYTWDGTHILLYRDGALLIDSVNAKNVTGHSNLWLLTRSDNHPPYNKGYISNIQLSA